MLPLSETAILAISVNRVHLMVTTTTRNASVTTGIYTFQLTIIRHWRAQLRWRPGKWPHLPRSGTAYPTINYFISIPDWQSVGDNG